MDTVMLKPIGYVSTARNEMKDDYWGSVESVVTLDGSQFTEEALYGLESFSHLEVIFHFHKVDPAKIEKNARHPRSNPDWPKVGIFSQRGKNRPNGLGLSTCKVVEVKGLEIKVIGLDAIDGTPVLDLKPYMCEFAPRDEVKQPEWSRGLMVDYCK